MLKRTRAIRGARTSRLAICGVVTTLAAAGGALTAVAATSTATTTGAIHVYETSPAPNAPGNIVITGAINDGGVGKTCSSGTVCGTIGNGKVVLSKGSIEDVASATMISREQDLYGRTLSAPACSLVGTITGPVNITGGTGAYAGITGTLNATYTVAAVLPKLPNGKCNTAHHTKPVGAVIFIKASGNVSFK